MSDVDRRHLERRLADRGKLERVSVQGLVALFLSVVAMGLAAFVTWRHYAALQNLAPIHEEQQRLAAAANELRGQLAQLEARLTGVDRRTGELGNLGARVASLAESVDELRARADSAQLPWIVAEARYLLEIANRRLSLERDTQGALAAMQSADQRLAAARDPGLNAARLKLASEMQAIRSLRQPDLAGLASRLAAAEEAAADFVVKGAIAERYEPPSRVEDSTTGFGRAWQILRSSLTGIVSVRRIGEDAVELVSIEEQGLRRQHMQLLLFAARVAALRGDEAEFNASISNARHWLNRMFDPKDQRVSALARELETLEKLDIAPPLPDISGSLALLDKAAGRLPAAREPRTGPTP